jgi:peptide subunit release factor 1 (eRF1)
MSLREQLRRLAALPPNRYPFASIYLNLTPQGPGILTYPAFLKKRMGEELRRYPERSPQRISLEKVNQRVQRFLDYDLQPTARSVAFFARGQEGEYFEAIPLPVDFPSHAIVVSRAPYVYPLVRLSHLFPVAVAAVVDTNTSRLFVLSLGRVQTRRELQNENVHKPQSGGMSHERYRRHAEDHYLHHAKQTAAAIDRLVRESGAQYLLLGGDEVILPPLKAQLPRKVRERILSTQHWGIRIPEHELADRVNTLIREAEESRSVERALEVIETAQAHGHAALGPELTLAALQEGKVDELVVAGRPGADKQAKVCTVCNTLSVETSVKVCPECGEDSMVDSSLHGEFVNRALAQGGQVQVVGPLPTLEGAGGVAAVLRY